MGVLSHTPIVLRLSQAPLGARRGAQSGAQTRLTAPFSASRDGDEMDTK